MSDKKPRIKIKVGQIKLTEHDKTVIASNLDSEFFKIIATKILPKRLIQVSLTSLAIAQNGEDLWFHKGKYSEVDWLKKFLEEQAANIDSDDDGDEELKSKTTT